MDKRTELLIKSQKEVTRLEKELHEAKLDYKVLEERNYITLQELQHEQNKWKELQRGGVGYWLNEQGQVLRAFPILDNFLTTYPQEIDYRVISSVIYQRFPYYYLDNGKMCIDNVQYKKYIGGIIL